MIETELHCPNCDYDLRGLPQNRCPECGEPFDVADLKELLEAAPKPIGLGGLLLLNLQPAFYFSVAAVFAVAFDLGWLLGGIFIAVIVVIPINAGYTVTRVFASFRRHGGRGPCAEYPRRYVIGVFAFLWLLQGATALAALLGTLYLLRR